MLGEMSFFMKIELFVFWGGPSSLCKVWDTKVFSAGFYVVLGKQNAVLRIDRIF